MFVFSRLAILHSDMKGREEVRCVFPFEYNGKRFSCIFLADVDPYRLYLTTMGISPQVFELEVIDKYQVNAYFSDYKKLVAYLELKYDPDHIFRPSDFFEVLNRNIPPIFTRKPNYSEVLCVVAKKRNIEEENKVYFCGWYTNPKGKNVKQNNLEKTRSAFGDDKAKMSKKKY